MAETWFHVHLQCVINKEKSSDLSANTANHTGCVSWWHHAFYADYFSSRTVKVSKTAKKNGMYHQ